MKRTLKLIASCAPFLISFCGCSSGGGQATWHLDNLESIGGHALTLEGNPRVIETPNGKAIEFDGVDDAIFLDLHPLEGMSTFTVEVVFKPYSDGGAEQRFFHMQEEASDSRVMFETRLVEGDLWFLDTFIKSGEQSSVLYAEAITQPVDKWYHAAIVVDRDGHKHYVNGSLGLSEALSYKPQMGGKTSIGVRMNKVSWFKGAVRTIRFTPRALSPSEFLTEKP